MTLKLTFLPFRCVFSHRRVHADAFRVQSGATVFISSSDLLFQVVLLVLISTSYTNKGILFCFLYLFEPVRLSLEAHKAAIDLKFIFFCQ